MAQNLSMEAAIGTLLRLKRASGWRVPLAKSGPIGATVITPGETAPFKC